MDPLTILAGLKSGLAAGRTIHSLSKEIGNFLMQQTSQETTSKKASSGSVNSIAMERFTKLREAAQLRKI